jgi:hypothetical protein
MKKEDSMDQAHHMSAEDGSKHGWRVFTYDHKAENK